MIRILSNGIIAAVAMLLCVSCGSKEATVEVVSLNGEDVYVCDISQVKDSVNLPLSSLVESIHIVKLDTAREALFKWGQCAISDNYIGIASSQQPYKLFSKNGKFLRNIGAVGKGPGEYLNIYCSQIDEKNNKIYLLPWQSGNLLCYNLEGEALGTIPMADMMPKGNFQVKNDKVTAFSLPFPGSRYFAWYEDMEGNVKHAIPSEKYIVPTGYFSNEIYSLFNTDLPDVYVFRWEAIQDSLYRYDGNTGRLIPRFTMVYPGKVPMHAYYELPNHFYAEIMEFDGRSGVTNRHSLIIDKNNKKVTWGKIVDDLFVEGGEVWPWSLKNSMYVQDFPAITLIDNLEKMLKRDDVAPAVRKQAEDILKQLDENDNNVIVWGKLKN